MRWALLKNVGYLTVGSQAANFFQFVFFLYFARTFGDEIVGRYSFAFSFTYVLSVLADLGISAYLTCEIAKRPTDYVPLLAKGLLLRLSSLVIMAVAGTVAVAKLFGGLDRTNVYLLALLGAYHFFCGVADLFLAELKGHDRMGLVAALGFSAKLLITAAGIALIAFGAGYLWVIACFPVCGLMYAAACIAWCSHLFGSPGWTFFDFHVGPVLRSALPFAFTLVFIEILYNADLLLVRAFADDQAVGMYSVGQRIVMIFPAMLSCVFTALLPTFTRLSIESAAKLNELSVQSLRYLVLFGLPVSAGLFALSDKIVALLFTRPFLPAAVGLRILSWMIAISCAMVVPSVLLTATGRQREKSIGIGICLAANVGANCFLIPRMGWQGAAWARLGADALQLAIMVSLAARLFGGIPWLNLLVKPAAGCAVMYVLIEQFHSLNVVVLVCIGVVAYFASLALLRGFEKHELALVAAATQRLGRAASRQKRFESFR